MRRKFKVSKIMAVALISLGMTFSGLGGLLKPSYAQQSQTSERRELSLLPVRGNIFMLVGEGSNITVSVGRDGILLVDSGTGQMSEQVVKTVQQLAVALTTSPVAATTCVGVNCVGVFSPYGWSSPGFNGATISRGVPKPIRYIINTSIDPEHAGGNEKVSRAGQTLTGGNIAGTIADAGDGAAIIAHDNVLARMSGAVEGETSAPSDALPTETYQRDSFKLSQFFNGEGVQLFHVPAAHTDGDSLVWFRYSDVISAGDIYSTVSYPVIDLKRGGSIQGILDGLNRILDVAYAEFRSQGGTMIIPGHGRLSDVADVANYRNMVSIVRDRIQDLINKGMTLEQVKASRPTLDYDGRWGSNTGSWTTNMFIEAVYKNLTQK
jgi:glyoxylase-like metal-dependent hydrolase (beta-lactamase superfamily II)